MSKKVIVLNNNGKELIVSAHAGPEGDRRRLQLSIDRVYFELKEADVYILKEIFEERLSD